MRNRNVTRMSIAAVFTLLAALALTAVKAPPVAATALTTSQWVTQRDNAWWMTWRSGNIALDGGPVYAGCRTADRYAELNGRSDPLGWCERELDIAGTAANCAGYRYDTQPGGRWQFTGPQAVELLRLFPAGGDLGGYMRRHVNGGDPGGYPWVAQDMLRLAAQAAGIYPMPDCNPDQQLLNVAATGDRWAVIQTVAPAYGVDPNVLWKIEACETGHYTNPRSENRLFTGGFQQLRTMWPQRSADAGVSYTGVWPSDGPQGMIADVQVAAWLYSQQGPRPWPVCGYVA
jgi:hypothetical protein